MSDTNQTTRRFVLGTLSAATVWGALRSHGVTRAEEAATPVATSAAFKRAPQFRVNVVTTERGKFQIPGMEAAAARPRTPAPRNGDAAAMFTLAVLPTNELYKLLNNLHGNNELQVDGNIDFKTRTGEERTFRLSAQEAKVGVPDAAGKITEQVRMIGTAVTVTPELMAPDRVRINLEIASSKLNRSQGDLPVVDEAKTQAHIDIAPGQSCVISGLPGSATGRTRSSSSGSRRGFFGLFGRSSSSNEGGSQGQEQLIIISPMD